MALENINVSQPNDHMGDTLRAAFIKTNGNFTYLLSLIDAGVTQVEFDAVISDIEANLSVIQTELNGKANVVHTHLINQIVGLQTALDSKVNTSTFNAAINPINANISNINDQILALQICCDKTSAYGLQEILDNGSVATITGDIEITSDDVQFNSSEFWINSIHPGNEPDITKFQRNGVTVAGVKDTGRVYGEDAEELDEFVTLRQLNAGGGGGSGSTYTTDGTLYIDNDVIGLNVAFWEDVFTYTGGTQEFLFSFEANLITGVYVNGVKLRRFVQFSGAPEGVTILEELDVNDSILITYQKFSNPIN